LEGRRGAYAAVARIAPNVLVEDGVVPRNKLAEIVRRIQEITERRKVLAALLFHAGDGNIHPNMPTTKETPRKPLASRLRASRFCRPASSWAALFRASTASAPISARRWPGSLRCGPVAFRRIKSAVDPQDIANPDKVIPLAGEEKDGSLFKASERPLSDYEQLLSGKVANAPRSAGR